MKKLGTILLVLAMILAMSVTAFAENTSLTINDSTGRTYNGYQLLTLTTGKICEHEEGATHTKDCYGYIYSINDKYKAILQAQADKDDILAYLSGFTGDTGDDYGTLREVADSIYRAIKEAQIEADEVFMSGTADIAQGYWLFADESDLDGDNAANSLVMVNTKGQDELIISPKVDLPTIEKKVQDINDSNDASIDDNNWQDSADHEIGDKVPFKLTATLPANVEYYDSYKLVFHDTLSNGLTLEPTSIQVFANGEDVKDVTANFTYPTESTSGEFTISCANVLEIAGVTKDTVFEVRYKATLNENAVIGPEGNPNEVYLEFSNNPYDEGTGETEVDKVIVFTYQLIINKVDDNNKPLKGAGFQLYKKNYSKDVYEPIGDELKGDNMITFEWKGLDDGDYKLEESTVPAGYNKMKDIEFTISAEHDEEADEPKLTSLTSTVGNKEFGEITLNNGTITKKIENNVGVILPETGAKGTMMLILCSCMFVMVAAVFMITRKKMSIYED